MSDTSPRHQLFQYARRRAEWSTQQLWVGYLALGGIHDAFDIEAFLAGLGRLDNEQQDILANAVSERLDDLYGSARVPYLTTVELPPCSCQDPISILDQLLSDDPPTTTTHGQPLGQP